MQRVIFVLLFLLLPMGVLADGMFISPVAFPTEVRIPDQRALICYSNGVERLVIETRFSGQGTNFAWVVPLPSQPVIEEATTGLFPTLNYLFQPPIKHYLPKIWLWILVIMATLYLIVRVCKSVSDAFIVAITVLFLCALLLPAQSTARSRGSADTPGGTVSILDRKIVGAFETSTIFSHEPKALEIWLRENGYLTPTNVAPAIEAYVKDGWVFVASKVRRDVSGSGTNTVHPLSFTFNTQRPVYPMKLTGIGNRSLSVELFVFGPDRANARHFNTERCTRPQYPPFPPRKDGYWARWKPETPNILHPLLRQWADGAPVATKLVATLSPSEMQNDVWISWEPFREQQRQVYSQQGAVTLALNWATAAFAVGLLFIWAASLPGIKPKRSRWKTFGNLLLATAMLFGLIYVVVPKIEVRVTRRPGSAAQHSLIEIHHALENTMPWTRSQIQATIGTNRPNILLGGMIHEEDSPGNYVLRNRSNKLEFVTFDAQGAERVVDYFENWPLPEDR